MKLRYAILFITLFGIFISCNSKDAVIHSGEQTIEKKIKDLLLDYISIRRGGAVKEFYNLCYPSLINSLSGEDKAWVEKNFYNRFGYEEYSQNLSLHEVLPSYAYYAKTRFSIAKEIERIIGKPKDVIEVKFSASTSAMSYNSIYMIEEDSKLYIVFVLPPKEVREAIMNNENINEKYPEQVNILEIFTKERDEVNWIKIEQE